MKKITKQTKNTIFIVAALVGICSYIFPRSPDTQKTDDIVGVWTSDYSYGTQSVLAGVNVRTSYFSNGKYNVNGRMSFKIDNANGKTALVEYYVSGAGEWVLHDKELIATLSSLKSIPDRIVSDGKDFDIQDLEILENIMRKKFPTIEERMAPGTSQSYNIKNDSHNQKLLEVINPFGNNFDITITREK